MITPPSTLPGLTSLEIAVLRGVAAGETTVQLAQQLGKGHETVKTYLKRLRVKLGIQSTRAGAERTAEFAAWAALLPTADIGRDDRADSPDEP